MRKSHETEIQLRDTRIIELEEQNVVLQGKVADLSEQV